MTTPNEYRAYAADCLRLMRRCSRPEVKAELLHIAQLWNELAEWASRARPLGLLHQMLRESTADEQPNQRGTRTQ